MNRTMFTSDTARLKIMGAMRRSATFSQRQAIYNRKGQPWLTTYRIPGKVLGRIFEFRTLDGRDVTELVYKSLAS